MVSRVRFRGGICSQPLDSTAQAQPETPQAPSMKGGAVGLLAAAGLGPVPIVNALLQRIRTSPGTVWAVVLGWFLVQGQEWTRLNYLLDTSIL